jgi:hypothetical protein
VAQRLGGEDVKGPAGVEHQPVLRPLGEGAATGLHRVPGGLGKAFEVTAPFEQPSAVQFRIGAGDLDEPQRYRLVLG